MLDTEGRKAALRFNGRGNKLKFGAASFFVTLSCAGTYSPLAREAEPLGHPGPSGRQGRRCFSACRPRPAESSADNLLSSKMDPPSKAKHRVCLLLITGCAKEAITVHNVTHIDEGAAAEAAYFMKKMRTLGMRAELQQAGEHKRMNEWSKTPDSAKKCRVLEVNPSGESLS